LANIMGASSIPSSAHRRLRRRNHIISLSLMRKQSLDHRALVGPGEEAGSRTGRGKREIGRTPPQHPPLLHRDELRRGAASPPSPTNSTTVLFTDFYSFSLVTELMGADELVAELDRHFTLSSAS
jgi:hypothetical protein